MKPETKTLLALQTLPYYVLASTVQARGKHGWYMLIGSKGVSFLSTSLLSTIYRVKVVKNYITDLVGVSNEHRELMVS